MAAVGVLQRGHLEYVADVIAEFASQRDQEPMAGRRIGTEVDERLNGVAGRPEVGYREIGEVSHWPGFRRGGSWRPGAGCPPNRSAATGRRTRVPAG